MGMKDELARIGKVIDHAIDKFIGVILETRKGYNQTIFLFNPSGDDSVPCKNDKVIIVKIDGTGNFKGLGILTESQGAKPGEKIFFGRDEEGKITSKLSMLNNGDVTFENDGNKSETIEKNFTQKINGDEKIDIAKNSKHTSANTDIHSTKPIGLKGTETQLGADVLQIFFDDLIKAVNRNTVIIPSAPLPPGVPVPPVPPLINMHLKGVWADIAAAATKAKTTCAKVLK